MPENESNSLSLNATIIGEPTLADWICDRLLHNCQKLHHAKQKGGKARELTTQRRFAPITIDR